MALSIVFERPCDRLCSFSVKECNLSANPPFPLDVLCCVELEGITIISRRNSGSEPVVLGFFCGVCLHVGCPTDCWIGPIAIECCCARWGVIGAHAAVDVSVHSNFVPSGTDCDGAGAFEPADEPADP